MFVSLAPAARGVLLASAMLMACAPTRRRCELAAPEAIAHSAGLSFDGLAVAIDVRARPVFAWSTAEGLFARTAGHAEQRIGDRCKGGIGVQADSSGAYVACARSGERDGAVVLYSLDAQLRTRSVHTLGHAGRDGRGVALALLGERVHVAFHDGSFGMHSVNLASLHKGELRVRRVSAQAAAASAPALLGHAGHLYLAYAELKLPPQARGEANSSIMLARDDQPAHEVQRSRVHDGAPTLAVDGEGLLLGYRDRKRDSARSELRVVRIDRQLRAAGAPRVIGRANAEGPPSVHGCPGLTAALLPREYGSERFVAVNQLDRELASVAAGHQFYTSGRNFVLASGACVRDGLMLFAADVAAPGKPGVDALAMRFSCR
jgi:hypothetical protein